MPRSRNQFPSYRKHKATGRAVVSVYRSDGSRTEILLPGEFGSDESKQEYERILAQLRAGNGKLPTVKSATDLTIAEIVQRYMAEHAEMHFRRADGSPTGELTNIKFTVRPLVRLFGSKLASEFTPIDLKVYRESLITGSWQSDEDRKAMAKKRNGGTTCRKTTNQRVSRVKGILKWAAADRLIPASVWHACQAVSGLQAGRSKARDYADVRPVPLEDVEKTLEHLPDVHAAIVRLQLYSGARMGEILSMRTIDINQAAENWVFTPTTHKNQWRNHDRNIVFGPRAQLVLRRYIRPDDPQAFIFVPGMGRKETVKTSRPRYNVVDIDKVIQRACVRAGVEHWSSHQLRHLAAHIAENEMNIEGARAFLGQKNINQTAHYSGIDAKKAGEVARRIG